MSENERDKIEIIQCGRLPLKADRTVDLYKIDRLLLEIGATSERVAILRRLLEQVPGRVYAIRNT